ncbi:hypothetical protein H4219_002048 [Mycoemilia scoparia]|uniref:Uncharacterized protein n=1 Tax=Mycoemilia scoparia TaxID=417184 RepID=A0A9W7ZYU8_9FUNG|nr:hypothetical protein H4219_002048 [Mycoemilia scoparia]
MSWNQEPRNRYGNHSTNHNGMNGGGFDNDDDKYGPKRTAMNGALDDESQQSQFGDGLESKISMLKQVTIDIGSEIRDQNKFLSMMRKPLCEQNAKKSVRFESRSLSESERIGDDPVAAHTSNTGTTRNADPALFVKIWTGEKLGREQKTEKDDDFKLLEAETVLKREGTENMQCCLRVLVDHLGKRDKCIGDTKSHQQQSQKMGILENLGYIMMQLGCQLPRDSDYGRILEEFGQSQQDINSYQHELVSNIKDGWLSGLESQVVVYKEFTHLEKKFEGRRLDYDSKANKLQRSRKENTQLEDDLRTAQIRYDDTRDELIRRMMDIQDSELSNIRDMHAFYRAQKEYHQKALERLDMLEQDFAAALQSSRLPAQERNLSLSRAIGGGGNSYPISRSNTYNSRNYDSESAQSDVFDSEVGGPPSVHGGRATTMSSSSLGANRYNANGGASFTRNQSMPPALSNASSGDGSVGYNGGSSQHPQRRPIPVMTPLGNKPAPPPPLTPSANSAQQHMLAISESPRTNSFGVASSMSRASTPSTVRRQKLPPPPPPPQEQQKLAANESAATIPLREARPIRRKAIYNFIATEEGELSIYEGDVIEIVEEVDDGWWIGRVATSATHPENIGLQGMFPANYTEEHRGKLPPPPPPIRTVTKQHNRQSSTASNGSGFGGPGQYYPKTPGSVVSGRSIGGVIATRTGTNQSGFYNGAADDPNLPTFPSAAGGGGGGGGGGGSSGSSPTRRGMVKAMPIAPPAPPSGGGVNGEGSVDAAAVPDCSTCGCNEYSPNLFKKGSCNNCFHCH